MPCLGSLFNEILKFYKRCRMKLLNLFLTLKDLQVFATPSWHQYFIIIIVKKYRGNCFFKSYVHCVDLNFIVPSKPEARTLLNQNSIFTPFGHCLSWFWWWFLVYLVSVHYRSTIGIFFSGQRLNLSKTWKKHYSETLCIRKKFPSWPFPKLVMYVVNRIFLQFQ